LVAEEEGAEGDDYVVEEMVVLEEAAAMETTEQSE
jgi:hypothetical protein